MFDSINEDARSTRRRLVPRKRKGSVFETARRSVRGKRPETDPPKVGMTLLEMLAEKLWPKEQGLPPNDAPINTTEAMARIREAVANCKNKSLIAIDPMKQLD